jgi:regulator of protease activity HflC (stomatin/prohibitin superfamily)
MSLSGDESTDEFSSHELLPAPKQIVMSDEDDGDLQDDVQANLCCPHPLSCVASTICFPCWLCSIKTFDQNEQAAVLVFGEYVGSINQPGIHIVNPCGVDLRRIDTQRKTIDVRDVHVTDQGGNPILISGNVAYKLYSAKKAKVDTNNPEEFMKDQAPMILRKVASRFTYDELRGDAVGPMLSDQLQGAVMTAGVHVLKFELTDLKYDPQIAQAMLAKQQATVQVDAKRAVVTGAAETASLTVKRLKEMGHNLTPEREQQLIHDLLLKNLDPEYKSTHQLMTQFK